MSDGSRVDGNPNEKGNGRNAKGRGGKGISDVNSILSTVQRLRAEKVLKFKGAGIEVEFSPIALIPEHELAKAQEKPKEESIDDLLFHSAPEIKKPTKE